ncbi:26815_t:CDS:2, partial [Dentiscutata erythropus]
DSVRNDNSDDIQNPKPTNGNDSGDNSKDAQNSDSLILDKDKHEDHEKAEALIIVGESTIPDKCKETISNQKDDSVRNDNSDDIQNPKATNGNDSGDNSKDAQNSVSLIFDKDKHEDYVIIEESTTPDKCKETISNQKNDGCIELSDSVRNDSSNDTQNLNLTRGNNVFNIAQSSDSLTFDKDKHEDYVIVEESATPDKCKEIVSKQKDDDCIESSDSVRNDNFNDTQNLKFTIGNNVFNTSKSTSDKNYTNVKQDQGSTIVNGDFNNSSKNVQNSTFNTKNSRPTSDSDNLNDKEDHDYINTTLSINAFNTTQTSSTIVKQDQGSTIINGGSFQDTQNSTYNTKQTSRFTSNNDNLNTKEEQDSINSTFDNNISNTTQNSRSISDNDNSNSKQVLGYANFVDSNPTPNTKQNLRSTNDSNDPYAKQDQASIITNNDSNNSFKQDLSSILDNYASNDKQNLWSTSGHDSLNVRKINDDLKVEKIKSIRSSKTISILVAVIAIIFGFAFYYGPIFDMSLPPVDSPIFRDLINTTNLLSGQLTELNIPASSVIMGYRVTSKNLADIINRNKLSSKNSDKVAQYLNQLGDKISNSGEAIEKMYSTGNHALKEISSELRFINDEISQEQVITRQDAEYFAERYGKILNAITKLRDEFRITLNELDDLYDLYIGTHHQLANGMKDVELFFDEVTPELKKLYNIEKLKRNLSYLKQIMKKIPDIRDRINKLLFEFNKHRLVLIGYRSEWNRFQRRKLVSFEDTERIEEMIQKLTYVIKIFAKKDLETTEKRIYI